MKLIAIDFGNCVCVRAVEGELPGYLRCQGMGGQISTMLLTMDAVRALVGKPETRIERDANGVDFQAMMFSRRT